VEQKRKRANFQHQMRVDERISSSHACEKATAALVLLKFMRFCRFFFFLPLIPLAVRCIFMALSKAASERKRDREGRRQKFVYATDGIIHGSRMRGEGGGQRLRDCKYDLCLRL
jgi:hypothetical protein